jgi:hypothetical protein
LWDIQIIALCVNWAIFINNPPRLLGSRFFSHFYTIHRRFAREKAPKLFSLPNRKYQLSSFSKSTSYLLVNQHMADEQQSRKQLTFNALLKDCVAPQWFALLIVLVYGSGFLCEYTFLDRFGIQESGQDCFRIKFIHVGILFLLFPISILIPIVLKISLKRIEFKASRALRLKEQNTSASNAQENSRDQSQSIPKSHREIREQNKPNNKKAF